MLANLQAKGLPGKTLVVSRTEFEWTPRIDDNDGQDEDDVEWSRACRPGRG